MFGLYRVLIHGTNIRKVMGDEGREAIGFYVNRWVSALSAVDARKQALEMVEDAPQLLGQRSVRLSVDQVQDVRPSDMPGRQPGFSFYADGEDPPSMDGEAEDS